MITVAIDGPAGAGKSTAAKLLAERMNLVHLDTGAMYRAVGLKALRLGIDCFDRESIIEMMKTTVVDVVYSDGVQHVFIDGEDVTTLIRTQEVSKAASDVSTIPEVRIKLAAFQRKFAEKYDVVMDGREIGSYVLPNAEFKFFVTASVEERARRRLEELKSKGLAAENADAGRIIEEIRSRDKTDSEREFAPLKLVEDAMVLDTTYMSIAEVVDKMICRIKGELK